MIFRGVTISLHFIQLVLLSSFFLQLNSRLLYQPWLSKPKTSPGKHLGFLLMSCLWNAYKTNKATKQVRVCACVFLYLYCIRPGISSYMVDMKQPFECVCMLVFGVTHQHFHCSGKKKKVEKSLTSSSSSSTPLLTPRAVAVCLFPPVIGSLLSAHETDGVRLMGVFVAPFASGGSGWESGAAVRGGRKTHSRYPPEGGERERQPHIHPTVRQILLTVLKCHQNLYWNETKDTLRGTIHIHFGQFIQTWSVAGRLLSFKLLILKL